LRTSIAIGPTAVEFGLDGFSIDRQPRWAAIHNHPHTAAVGFAKRADPKELAEAAAHEKTVLGWSLQAGCYLPSFGICESCIQPCENRSGPP
jgi:hypothetical protein